MPKDNTKKNIVVDKVFLGHTPSEQRKFVVYYLKKYKDQFPKIHVPCAGEFSLVRCAIDAGYKPEDISCSDICLFTSLLGYYFMGKSVFDLGFIVSEELQAEMDKYPDEGHKIAVMFFYMKKHQYRDYFFDQLKLENIVESKDEYVEQIFQKLETMKSVYGGVTYFIEDLRDTLVERKDTLVIINPPAFAKGYEKMFSFQKDIQFSSGIAEFSLAKEYDNLFKQSMLLDSPFLWYKYQSIGKLDSNLAIFAKEYPKNRLDYWLINNRKFYTERPVIVFKSDDKLHKIKAGQFTQDEITEDSKVVAKVMKEENCLYYRDLWAHKLGVTKAELYIGFFIDGKLFGITGLMLNRARSLQSNEVFENFGFVSPNDKYPTLNRLLMMLLTCTQMQKFIYNTTNKNRIFKIEDFRTTCLSKYRKVKLNNGILEVEKREKMGQWYKIMYTTKFYKRDFSECVKEFLKELKTKENDEIQTD